MRKFLLSQYQLNASQETRKMPDKDKLKEYLQQADGKINPFLLPRDQFKEIDLVAITHRVRSDYADILKVLKTIKKGYTLEAILDDILTHYFENTNEGRGLLKNLNIYTHKFSEHCRKPT